jgi:predicted RNA-binding protein with RPS1 domain
MFLQNELIILVLLCAEATYSFNNGYAFLKKLRFGEAIKTPSWASTNVFMSESIEVAPVITKPSNLKSYKTSIDFSSYSVGQEYEGTVVNVQPFGVFVNINNGVDVLIPRSLLNKPNYDKLKNIVDTKSMETVKISLVSVSPENKTLSGKYIPPTSTKRADLSTLEGKDVLSKTFTATVVSLHDFGIFAQIDELGVQGLVPSSKLPHGTELT